MIEEGTQCRGGKNLFKAKTHNQRLMEIINRKNQKQIESQMRLKKQLPEVLQETTPSREDNANLFYS